MYKGGQIKPPEAILISEVAKVKPPKAILKLPKQNPKNLLILFSYLKLPNKDNQRYSVI